MAATDVETLHTARWDDLEKDVLERIRVLRVFSKSLTPDNPLHEKIANDLILPNLKVLGAFCEGVHPTEDDNEGNVEADKEVNE